MKMTAVVSLLPVMANYADTLPSVTPTQLGSDGETHFEQPQAGAALNSVAG